jgi:hypothetical protein
VSTTAQACAVSKAGKPPKLTTLQPYNPKEKKKIRLEFFFFFFRKMNENLIVEIEELSAEKVEYTRRMVLLLNDVYTSNSLVEEQLQTLADELTQVEFEVRALQRRKLELEPLVVDNSALQRKFKQCKLAHTAARQSFVRASGELADLEHDQVCVRRRPPSKPLPQTPRKEAETEAAAARIVVAEPRSRSSDGESAVDHPSSISSRSSAD